MWKISFLLKKARIFAVFALLRPREASQGAGPYSGFAASWTSLMGPLTVSIRSMAPPLR